MSIPALTIWQPWASLIMVGAKPWEFRGWQPPKWLVGKRMGVHAGARPMKYAEVVDLINGLSGTSREERPCLVADVALPFLEKVRRGFLDHPDGIKLPRSALLGIVTVGVPERGDVCARALAEVERRTPHPATIGNDSDREGTFNWGWPMLDIKPLMPPIEMSGRQGLWRAQIDEVAA